ncbi:peptidase inhibitor family I36 protein [Streptomyces sp. NPDC059680]|uniref:peptidase inhibitor family I36 protein n=1 Tax=Streptomyces sp. NPDC059680 TaxID=3346904 RepID=UPI00367BC456
MTLGSAKPRLLLMAVVSILALAFSVQASPAGAVGNSYAAQAERAGLTARQAHALQRTVDKLIVRTHGRQTGPNTIAFRGGDVTVADPGEKYARDLRTTFAPAASDSCPYANFCAYTGASYTGHRYDFYSCTKTDTSSYLLTGGSWSNNQTQHRRVYMYGSSGSVIYTTPNAFYHTPNGDWSPVYAIKTCITAA